MEELYNWILQEYRDGSDDLPTVLENLKISDIPESIAQSVSLNDLLFVLGNLFGDIDGDCLVRINLEDDFWSGYSSTSERGRRAILNYIRHEV